MELALHIGTPRTGTAAVQGWFAAARDWLASHGVHYPTSPGAANHIDLALYARDFAEGDHFFLQAGLRDRAGMAAFRARLRRRLHDERAATPPGRIWVMSNEHLSYMLTTPETVARLRALLAPHFPRIRVFLHLRPQVDLILAMAAQDARLGRRVTRASLTRRGNGPGNPQLDYLAIARRWARVFGPDAVELVPYRRQPCMVSHLADRLGLPVAGRPPVHTPDETLGWRAIALANCIDRPLLTRDRNVNPDREMFLDQLPGDEPLSLGPAIARSLHARFAEDNATLARLWQPASAGATAGPGASPTGPAPGRLATPDPRPASPSTAPAPLLPTDSLSGPAAPLTLRSSDLTPDWRLHDRPETLSALEAPCAFQPQLDAMVRLFNQALRKERAARLRAEAALAAQRGASTEAERLRHRADSLDPPTAAPAPAPPDPAPIPATTTPAVPAPAPPAPAGSPHRP